MYTQNMYTQFLGPLANPRMSNATEVGEEEEEEEVVATEPNASVSIESVEPENLDEGEEEGAKELLPWAWHHG